MQRLALTLTVLILSACASAEQGGSTTPTGEHGASVGPRDDDAYNDQSLQLLERNVARYTGNDRVLAQLRLLNVQTRAFVIAVAHALPLGSHTDADAGASTVPASASRFDPSTTLITMLDAVHECEGVAAAHACAAKMGNTLLARINALALPADLEPVKAGLLTTLAALGESHVGIATEARWRVLQQGDDPGAHLSQALTLLLVTRQFAQALSNSSACQESAHVAARLADQLAIGACSDAYQQLMDPSSASGDARTGLSALATAGCVPTCSRSALSGSTSDAVGDAAQGCRSESTETILAPFEQAAVSVSTWASAARTRLEALRGDDAVVALLALRPTLPAGAQLPMPPPLFRAASGVAVEVPPVASSEGSGLAMSSASVLVWVPSTGDVIASAAPTFSLDGSQPVVPRAGPIEGLSGRLIQAAGPPETNGTRRPAAIVMDRNARAARFIHVLSEIAHVAENGPSHDQIVGLAVRNGPFSGYLPVQNVSDEPDHVFRIGERQIVVIDHSHGAHVFALTPVGTTGPDLLGGAIPTAAPTGPIVIEIEEDTTGMTLARVVDALAVYAARGTHPEAIGVAGLATGAIMLSAIDSVHSEPLRAAIESHRMEATHCLDAVVRSAGELAPRVDLHLLVDARGRITRADGVGDAPRTEAAVHCVTNLTRRWRLPAPGVATELRVPFVLDREPN